MYKRQRLHQGQHHSPHRLKYLVTPRGLAHKTRLTYEYLRYSLQLYGQVQQSFRSALGPLAEDGVKRVALCGTGEAAELAYLTLRELGLEPARIFDDTPGGLFLGVAVRLLNYSRFGRLLGSVRRAPGLLGRLGRRVGGPARGPAERAEPLGGHSAAAVAWLGGGDELSGVATDPWSQRARRWVSARPGQPPTFRSRWHLHAAPNPPASVRTTSPPVQL